MSAIGRNAALLASRVAADVGREMMSKDMERGIRRETDKMGRIFGGL